VGGASERGWKPGHLNPTIEECVDEVVELDVDIEAGQIADDDTLIGAGECYYKDVEVSDSEGEERETDKIELKEGGLRRKRTIRVIIRSRAFL